MRIIGFHSGHDSSYGILEDGIPLVHNELERFNRRKNSVEDSLKFFNQHSQKENIIIDSITTHRTCGIIDNNYIESLNKCENKLNPKVKSKNKLIITGHHQAHASNAFFTSDFKESLIVTIDGGGIDYLNGDTHKKSTIDKEGSGAITTCTTFWYGVDNKIEPIKMIDKGKINLGKDWALCTSKIFGLGTCKDPRGDQAGTVMGMAALGNPKKYLSYFKGKLTVGLFRNDNKGAINFNYLNQESNKSEQNKFDIAASLQQETEMVIKNLLTPLIKKHQPKNLCLSGGVSLNCVAVGKILDWFPGINVFCDPIPYDAGLALGSARYLWHHILDNPRIYNNPKNRSPYLGHSYSKTIIQETINKFSNKVKINKNINDDYVINELINKKIISVFGGGSESGRRALGNRSILADPRHKETKDIVNKKVKHRQWFRPFAPSILKEDVKDWFIHDVDSPYMSFALPFKKNKSKQVPAVAHFNNTARLQTVKEEDNKWYYNFIKKFKDKTEVPILLNTSFNDREPIVETPEHAIKCFLKTDIDYLYFRDYEILLSKK
tara:strand:- start:1448 stop:3097 length:1650 start_codon:yes stop_codon:yes gene_type:complete